MITSAQIRAGRSLLKWTQAALASRAAVSVVTLNMIETDQVVPRSRTLVAIRSALESQGVRFIDHGEDGVGVMLRPAAGHTGSPSETVPP
jgi:transcriptional regulator with XRE-family HTH domain